MESLGRNCYSDGEYAYYCAPYTVSNDSLTALQEVWQTLEYKFFDGEKPQTYLYPFKALPHSETPYVALDQMHFLSPVMTNGKFVYFKGDLMEDANPNSLKEITELNEDDIERKSDYYFADNKNVYFEHLELKIKANPELYTFNSAAQSLNEYLINPQDGMVYFETVSFDKAHAPYTLLSKYSSHVYQTLFLSDDGVYFYNTKDESVERAGDNPFLNGDYEEIAPLVFFDGYQTLYIDAKEHRSTGSRGTGNQLLARSTSIYELSDDSSESWVKLGEMQSGTVWEKGGSFYYFDEYGESQLIFYTIYEIESQNLAEEMLQGDFHREDIRDLINSEKLLPAKGEMLLEARTTFRKENELFYAILIVFAGLVGAVVE